MLHFSNFKKSYGFHPVLKIDDLVIEQGVYWVKGLNGSGKSTLLKTIAGILAFEGDIWIGSSVSVKRHPVDYRMSVNFAEAEPIFPGFLTGKEMVDLFMSAKKASKEQAAFLVETMKIAPYINQPLARYSSGMIKKLSLVLAFLGNPKLILLDEPLITLDNESLVILYELIQSKHHKDGTGFLLSSHQNFKHKELTPAKTLLVEDQSLKFVD